MDEIVVQHQGYFVVLPESLYFDAIPVSVHSEDGFPESRPVQIRSIVLSAGTLNGRPYIQAYGKRRLKDGGLSAQHFAGCTIRWSQIPTEVRKMINAKAGSDVRKWWRA